MTRRGGEEDEPGGVKWGGLSQWQAGDALKCFAATCNGRSQDPTANVDHKAPCRQPKPPNSRSAPTTAGSTSRSAPARQHRHPIARASTRMRSAPGAGLPGAHTRAHVGAHDYAQLIVRRPAQSMPGTSIAAVRLPLCPTSFAIRKCVRTRARASHKRRQQVAASACATRALACARTCGRRGPGWSRPIGAGLTLAEFGRIPPQPGLVQHRPNSGHKCPEIHRLCLAGIGQSRTSFDGLQTWPKPDQI